MSKERREYERDFEMACLFGFELAKPGFFAKRPSGRYDSPQAEAAYLGYALAMGDAQGQLGRFAPDRGNLAAVAREVPQVTPENIRAVLKACGGIPA